MAMMYVGPSDQARARRNFFAGEAWRPDDLAELIERDEPGAAFFEIETQINGLYRALQMAQALSEQFGIPLVAARYVSMGVRPIWFDRFDEIPGLIRSLR